MIKLISVNDYIWDSVGYSAVGTVLNSVRGNVRAFTGFSIRHYISDCRFIKFFFRDMVKYNYESKRTNC